MDILKKYSRSRSNSTEFATHTSRDSLYKPALPNLKEDSSSIYSVSESISENSISSHLGRAKSMRLGHYTISRKSSVVSMAVANTSNSSPRTSISADASLLAQERLVELFVHYENPLFIDDKIATEMLNLAMCCGVSMAPDARDELRKKPIEQKMQFVRHIYSGLSINPDTGFSSLEIKTPKFYVDYIVHITIEIQKRNLNSAASRGALALGFVGQMARQITHRVINSPSSLGNNSSINTSSSLGFSFNEARDMIMRLSVDCAKQSVNWLIQFIDLGGFKALFNLLDTIHKKPDKKVKHYEVEAQVLTAMKILTNHERGIEDLLSHPSSLNILIMSVNSPNLPTRNTTINFLLGVVTIDYPLGHKLVIDAFNFYRDANGETYLFQILVQSINEIVNQQGIWGSRVGGKRPPSVSNTSRIFVADNGLEKGGDVLHREIKEYLISAMTLVRYVIQTPIELEYRIYLRNMMMCCGLSATISTLKTWAKSEFETILLHVDAIELDANADNEEFLSGLPERYLDSNIDISDPIQALPLLLESFKIMPSRSQSHGFQADTTGLACVSNIIRQLLIPARLTDGHLRLKYFVLIDRIISQIVMDQSGLVPDFTDVFKTSVINVLENLPFADNGKSEEVARLGARFDQLQFENRILEERIASEVANKNKQSLIIRDDIICNLYDGFEQYQNVQNASLDTTKKDLDHILQCIKSERWKKDKSDVPKSESKIAISVLDKSHVAPQALPDFVSLPDSKASQELESSMSNEISLSASQLLLNPPTEALISHFIPAPPPPPMMPQNTKTSGVPAPPPPPGSQFSALLPIVPQFPQRHQVYHPSVEVRRLQWDKIPDSAIKGTIWSSIQISLKTSTSGKLSGNANDKARDDDLESMVQTLGVFTEIDRTFAAPGKGRETDTPGSDVIDAKKEICFIDSKRAQNICKGLLIFIINLVIMLGRLKRYSADALGEAILQLNGDVLSESVLKQFIAYAPTSEDKLALAGAALGDDTKTLSRMRKSEQFLCAMMKIDSLEQRLLAHLFRSTYTNRVIHLDKDIQSFTRAFKALKECTVFPRVLELILVIGNYMNSGTFQGLQHGFKISSLNKLGDMKTVDGKQTLLQFLTSTMARKFPHLLKFQDELEPVAQTSRVSFQSLCDDLKEIQSSLALLDRELVRQQRIPVDKRNPKDAFISIMQPFREKIKVEIEALEGMLASMETLFLSVAEFYGDVGKKIKPEEFLLIFKTFLGSFESALSSYHKDCERDALAERRRLALLEREKSKEQQQPQKSDKEKDEIKGVMDNLLESLKRGSTSSAQHQFFQRAPRVSQHASEKKRRISSTNVHKIALEMLGKLQEPETLRSDSATTL